MPDRESMPGGRLGLKTRRLPGGSATTLVPQAQEQHVTLAWAPAGTADKVGKQRAKSSEQSTMNPS